MDTAGGLAVLKRALVSFSIYSLAETFGGFDLRDSPLSIPVAVVTNEDVDLFGRLTNRGKPIEN